MYDTTIERYDYCMTKSMPIHALYGVPANAARLAHVDGARLAPPSAPYVGRGNKCSANDDTCEGMRAKGTELCMGHLRAKNSSEKFLAETVSKDGD